MEGDTLVLSQPTISRQCKHVGEAISGLAGRFIQFPEGEEAVIVKQNFGNLAGKCYYCYCFCILKLSNLHCRERLLFSRDETIWRYIDTISIRWVTICIAAQHDILRYDPDIRIQGKAMHFHCIFSIRQV